MRERKIRTEIVVEVRELLYDIRNKSWQLGRTMEASDYGSYERASNIQLTSDPEEDYEVKRGLAMAYGELRSLLNEWLADRCLSWTDNKLEDELEDEGQLRIELELPGNYRREALGGLGNAVHSYLVDRGLYNWFLLTEPAEAGQYLERSMRTGEMILGMMYKRERPKRLH